MNLHVPTNYQLMTNLVLFIFSPIPSSLLSWVISKQLSDIISFHLYSLQYGSLKDKDLFSKHNHNTMNPFFKWTVLLYYHQIPSQYSDFCSCYKWFLVVGLFDLGSRQGLHIGFGGYFSFKSMGFPSPLTFYLLKNLDLLSVLY